MWWTLAFASPSVVSTPTHGVHGTVVVAAPVERVRSDLNDPTFVLRIDDTGTTVKLAGTQDGCPLVDTTIPSIFKTITYTLRHCATNTGVQGTMVESNTFKTYTIEWVAHPHAGGTELSYTVEMTSSLAVPQFVLDAAGRKGIRHMLTQLERHYQAPSDRER